jgi:Septation protein etd1
MFDCSQVYPSPQANVHASPNLLPKATAQPDSSPPLPPVQQTQRTSLSLSEPTSTTFGSDNERVFSSGDEESMEFQSDTAYDSVATRATMSSGCALSGLEIERLFDGSLPSEVKSHSFLPFEELLPRALVSEPSLHDDNSLDGLDSVPNSRDDHSIQQDIVDYLTTPTTTRENQSQPKDMPSSPPSTSHHESVLSENAETKPIPAESQSQAIDDGERWDEDILLDSTFESELQSPELPQFIKRRLSPPLLSPYQNPLPQHRQVLDDTREEQRLSIFDWSEQPRSDRESPYGSSPRPRTVHSRQGNDARGGRAPGRRPPNALHLRSQSVPVAKESHMDSDPGYPPAKFGTWGLGKKGVSEEWTDDFEFDEVDDYDAQHTPQRLAPGMRVPQAIIDRQASVHGQFGQVQEFMLLVEELKRLRHQGSLLGLISGSSHHLWEDAESIINLATLNEDEELLMSPQSPGFLSGFDDFDEDPSLAPRPRQQSNIGTEDGCGLEPLAMVTSIPATPPTTGRPRRESLAQAKSFLQTMHQNRTGFESSPLEDRSHPPKLPFDTQDLRDLVARTGVVTRALKDIVRKAEGVFISPDRTPKEPQDPPFSQIFNRPESESPTSQKPHLPKSTSVNSYMNGSLATSNSERDRPGHMSMMAVV